MITMDASVGNPVIIAVGGGSGAGKTTLCQQFLKQCSDSVAILRQDSYYKDLSHLPHAERSRQNFDHPDAFDNDLLYNHLVNLKQGKSIHVPEYDFTTHTRTGRTKILYPKEFVIVEGVLVLFYPGIRELCDYKVYLAMKSKVRFNRRLKRDTKERGRTIHSVVMQYVQTVKPMHMKFVEPTKKYADVVVDGGSAESFISCISKYIDGVKQN